MTNNTRRIVIYTRYSTAMQRPESCEDQERKVREGLDRLKIDHQDALVLKDEAVSGLKDDRENFNRLRRMVEEGRVSIVAVDDQSRLTRSASAISIILDFDFAGTRFISTGENIDTSVPGWEMMAGFVGLSHNAKSRDTGRQCRRGLEGRFLNGYSTGSIPFGYRTEWAAPDWQEQLRSGRHVPKRIVIDEGAANTVRAVFDLYVSGGLSMPQIAKKLNSDRVPKGALGRNKPWSCQNVRQIIMDPRYLGNWSWGRSKVVRNGAGKTRSAKAPPTAVLNSHRPHLRIVEDDIWHRAQSRRKDVFAKMRPNGNQRALSPNFFYPKHCLASLVKCGCCGAHLTISRHLKRDPITHLRCLNYDRGTCQFGSYANAAEVERVLIEYISQVCSTWPDWLGAVVASTRIELDKLQSGSDERLKGAAEQLQGVEKQISNLLDVAATANAELPSLPHVLVFGFFENGFGREFCGISSILSGCW